MELKAMKLERRENGICVLTIDNPPANTLSMNLQSDVYKIAEELGNDPKVRVIVFTSANPKIFIAGADLGAMSGADSGEHDMADGVRAMQEAFNQLEKIPKPTIAAINGHALGGGCEFALACDFRIMSGGTIGLTEISLGLLPAAGGTQRMTRLLGQAKATELMFLSKRLNPEEAEKIGLITRAVAPEDLMTEALALADQLANSAVKAMGLAKQCILAAGSPIEDGLKVECASMVQTFTTGEPDEGMKAFFEKRKPDYINAVKVK